MLKESGRAIDANVVKARPWCFEACKILRVKNVSVGFRVGYLAARSVSRSWSEGLELQGINEGPIVNKRCLKVQISLRQGIWQAETHLRVLPTAGL